MTKLSFQIDFVVKGNFWNHNLIKKHDSYFPDSRCFTHRQILRPYSKSTKKLAVLFTPIETKSVSDAECMQLLKTGPVILMDRFRDVACTHSNLEESMPTVSLQFLSRHMIKFSPILM